MFEGNKSGDSRGAGGSVARLRDRRAERLSAVSFASELFHA